MSTTHLHIQTLLSRSCFTPLQCSTTSLKKNHSRLEIFLSKTISKEGPKEDGNGALKRMWSEISNLPHTKHSYFPDHFFFFSWTGHWIRPWATIHTKILTFNGILHFQISIICWSITPPNVIILYKDLEEYFLELSRSQNAWSLPVVSSVSLNSSKKLFHSFAKESSNCLLNCTNHCPFT